MLYIGFDLLKNALFFKNFVFNSNCPIYTNNTGLTEFIRTTFYILHKILVILNNSVNLFYFCSQEKDQCATFKNNIVNHV